MSRQSRQPMSRLNRQPLALRDRVGGRKPGESPTPRPLGEGGRSPGEGLPAAVVGDRMVKDHRGGISPPAGRAQRAYPLDAPLYTIIHSAAKKTRLGRDDRFGNKEPRRQ